MKTKLGCTASIWLREVTRASRAADIDHVPVLAGTKGHAYQAVRWGVWRDLVGRGYSYHSIGQASGFDHATVRNACNREVRNQKLARYDAARSGQGYVTPKRHKSDAWDHDPFVPERDWLCV